MEAFIDGKVNPDYIKWMEMDDENYHSDTEFINSSNIKQSLNCMDAVLAQRRGEHKITISKTAALAGTLFHVSVLDPQKKEAFIVANDSDMRSSTGKINHAENCDKKCTCPWANDKMLTKKHIAGCSKRCSCPKLCELKSDFQNVDRMVKRLEEHQSYDAELKFALSGQKEVVLVAQIEGIWCKCKIDVMGDGHITDLKSSKNFHTHYDEQQRQRVNWYERYRYVTQMAFYREIFKINFGEYPEVYIVGISKEFYSDIEFLKFHKDWPIYETRSELQDNGANGLVEVEVEYTSWYRWELEMHQIKEQLTTISMATNNDIGADRCEKCDWCRKTKKLNGATIVGSPKY